MLFNPQEQNTLQMKGWWESNINVFTLKPNKKFTTRINFFHLQYGP